jgi:hypothetical protein
MARKEKPLDKFVKARTTVQQNQTGSGFIADRRTRRNRDRSTRERHAVEEQHDGD